VTQLELPFVFVESSVIVAYCRGREDIFNSGAIMLYEKLRNKKAYGIITETVKNEVTSKINGLVGSMLKKRKLQIAHSLVDKRGKFLESVEIRRVGPLFVIPKVEIVKSLLKNVPSRKLQEVMLKKERKHLTPEPSDIWITAEALALKDEIETTLYLASTDQDFTYLLADELISFGVIVDFPSIIASRYIL
jgi:hypothetical protein